MTSSVKPIIGITGSYSSNKARVRLNRTYLDSVERAGGLPLVLPVLASPEEDAVQTIGLLDGLLLTGGGDVDPAHFDQEPHAKLGSVEPERDAVELALTRQARAARLPVLAICRGIQVLNVAWGGTLYQDISSQVPDALQHRQKAPRWHASHTVKIKAGSRLSGVMGAAEELRVNSFHHQAVRKTAPDLMAVAHSVDGIVEGMELPGGDFVLGVQWHPECMIDHHPHFLKLFTALVEAAGAN